MTNYQSTFLLEAAQRGFLQAITDPALDELFATTAVTVYIGFDCTADSLHVGSLLQLMLIRLLRKHGHKPLVLLGGGTTKIGDPSGKDEARQLLTSQVIAQNMHGIGNVIARLCGEGLQIVNNADWLDSINYIDFLRDYGRHFSVNRMLTFDSVRLRLDRQQPLSFLEFNYSLLQAYDFLELHKQYGCMLQAGGSDQWGNIVSGVDLVRRCANAQVYGLTTPLLTTAAGHKMGKTAQGAVWLCADKTTPYDYWQYWRNTDDADVVKFLRLFTDLPLEQIATYETLTDEALNEAKIVLANAALALVHPNAVVDAPPELSVANGTNVLDALVQGKFAPSRAEARRLVQGGGVRLADAVVSDIQQTITPAHEGALLVVGKKRQAKIVVHS